MLLKSSLLCLSLLKTTYCLPTSLVLYNTIESDVALAYLPTATVTIVVEDMIMSLVIGHEP